MGTPNIDKTSKEFEKYLLGRMVYSREFLYMHNIITEEENNEIHDRIKEFQNEHQIDINGQELSSIYKEL